MSRVPELWQGIETWMKEHLPDTFHSLRPGATEAQIHEFENKVGLTLPEQWRDLYRLHDGQENTHPAMMTLLWFPLEQVGRVWGMWKNVLEEADGEHQRILSRECTSTPDGAILKQYISLGWLPTFSDSADCIGPDFTPGPDGEAGQLINFGRDQMDKYVIARDLEGWLTWMLRGLHSGKITVQTASTGAQVMRLRASPYESIFEDLKRLCRTGPLDA